MKLDNDKIDQGVLALLLLGLHDGSRVWKGFDWEALNRLHENGFISDPHGKAKSVVLTERGLTEAQYLLEQLFSEQTEGLAQYAKETVYAIVRFDHSMAISADSFTVKEIVRSQAIADSKVERLNQANGDKHCSYFFQETQLFPAGRSVGDARGETS
jgi:DNA-binding PadR family transcriptional regulator